MVRDRPEFPDDTNPAARGSQSTGADRIRFLGESYRLLFEKNPLPMWVFDIRSQRFLAVNEAAVHRYGYTRDEFLRLTIRDIRPPEDLPALDRELERLSSDVESYGIWRHRTKDGRVIHVEVLSNEIDFNSHRARIVLAHDITDRLRVERSLRTGYAVTRILESAESFHAAVPQILRAVCEEAGWEYGELWRLDPDRDALRWDGAWRIPGFPSEELERASAGVQVQRGKGIPGTTWATGKPEWLTDLSPRAAFARVEPAARLHLRQGLSFPIKGQHGRVLGVMVFFSRSTGDPDETFLELIADLGNRMGLFLESERNEEQRRRLEERFTKAFYRSPLPGAISRLDGSLVLDVNDSFVRTFGYRREEVVGKTSAEVQILESIQHGEDLRGLLTRGESVRGVEATLRTKGGEVRMGRLWSERVDTASEPTVLTIFEDITDLRLAEARLLETQRLASIGETAAFVAHEINTPLTNIALTTALLARGAQDPDVKAKLDRIDEQRRHASRIISELLSFTRSRDGTREATDLRELVRMASEETAAYRKPDVAVHLDLGEDPATVSADPLRLLQVFVNLFKNAFQATERGRVAATVRRDAGAVTVRVHDTGVGIAPEDRAHLFEPFWSTKPRGEGTGLGLAFVKTVVTSHGGTVDVDSPTGQGTTFTVRLPVEPPARGPAA